MEAKHTPGPWVLADENNQCCSVLLGDRFNLTCSLDRQDGNTGEFVINRDEMLANAHLIAAAPDLLAACQSIITAWEFGAREDMAEHWIREAIAKATGSAK